MTTTPTTHPATTTPSVTDHACDYDRLCDCNRSAATTPSVTDQVTTIVCDCMQQILQQHLQRHTTLLKQRLVWRQLCMDLHNLVQLQKQGNLTKHC